MLFKYYIKQRARAKGAKKKENEKKHVDDSYLCGIVPN